MQHNLLDTHTLIWYINGDPELSQKARTAIETNGVINFVSIASLWEIAIKISLGKLELKTPFDQLGRQIRENGFEVLPILFEDTLVLSTLPFHHKDPFDRIIVVQGLNNGLAIVSKDPNFDLYKAYVIW
ncbi:MAG: type II toxin-antitoxin system VapC family toxin [Bacteroidota bacterium]|nr:type II toxin-antitoxin system VapC family toxin [Bacteroidota bacterium]